jgi:hypothetical protein
MAAPSQNRNILALQEELLRRFGGVTSIQREFPLQGLWRSENQVFQDRVVVLTVMDFKTRTDFEILTYLKRLKTRLKKRFEQLEILITVQELLAI